MKVQFHFSMDPTELTQKIFEEVLFECNGPFVSAPTFSRDLEKFLVEDVFASDLAYPQQIFEVDSEYDYKQFIRATNIAIADGEYRDKLKTVFRAILKWSKGEPFEDYKWSESDDHYPIDNGVSITPGKLAVWVYGSSLEIIREGVNEFFLVANGSRHSFECNFTGGIARRVIGLTSRCPDLVRNIEIESQGQSWDCDLKRLFHPTLSWEVKNLLLSREKGLLNGVRSAKVQEAARMLVEALRSKEASDEHKKG